MTGHNIANVNTTGYTRQQVILATNKPIIVSGAIFGTGVNVAEVARYRDAAIDRQFRTENQTLGDAQKQSDAMGLIEGVLNEPSDTGLHSAISKFFDSLQDLSVNPESSSVRTTVREQGRTMARMFNQTWTQLDKIRENKNFEIIDKVRNINVTLQRIGQLNIQIGSTEALGREANDLRDARDVLLDNLSKMVDMSSNEDPANGGVNVSIAGQSFVTIGEVNQIEAKSENIDGVEVIKIYNPVNHEEMKISFGELHGLLDTRDRLVPELQKQLDTLASSIIDNFNEIHRQGYGLQGGRLSPPTGIDFFDGTDAQSMALTPAISSDPGNIATSSSGEPGDNTNALALAQLRNKQVLNDNSFTFEDYYGGIVSTFGLETSTVSEGVKNQQLLVDHLSNFRESQNGVNIDEELVSLIRFQKSFGANARVISTVNEMMGVVVDLGRY